MGMARTWITVGVIVAFVVVVLAILYSRGQKLQKKQAEQRETMVANGQPINLLVIDKKRMALKDAGLPSVVMEQTSRRSRYARVYVVKAKVGPRVMTLIADDDVYDLIPVKAEIRATVSGIYIIGVNNFRNAPLPPKEKKGLVARITGSARRSQENIDSAKVTRDMARAERKARRNDRLRRNSMRQSNKRRR